MGSDLRGHEGTSGFRRLESPAFRLRLSPRADMIRRRKQLKLSSGSEGNMTADSPESAMSEWIAAGFATGGAQTFIDASVPLAVARQWIDAGIGPDDAVDFIGKAVPPDHATDFSERGIEPWQVTRTDTGFEVELPPWQRDPLEQLPAVIKAGRFGLSIWSVTPWDGEYLEHEVSVQWDGRHVVEWSVLSGSGLSMMSEVSFRGVAGWPDGKDLLVTYSGDDGRGFQRLRDAVPTADGSDGPSARRWWLGLANSIVGLTEELLNSGIEDSDEFADWYRRTGDDEWIEFDELFRLYLDKSGADRTLPDFDDWIAEALEDGTFGIES